MNNYEIQNIPVQSLPKKELYQFINELHSAKHPHHIITLNTDFIRIASKDKEFHHLCRNGNYNFIDGVPLKWLFNLKYNSSAERITGNDLFDAAIQFADDHSLKAALVGSSQKVLNKVELKINKLFPSISLFTLSPQFMFEKNESLNREVINRLKHFSPNLLFVALGCPRQEIWIHNIMNEVGSTINIGIGSVFEYYSGITKRAPVFMQNLGLEWFWRFLHNPKRFFKRYFYYDLPFYFRLFWKVITNRS